MAYVVDSKGTARGISPIYAGERPCGCRVAVVMCPEAAEKAKAVAAARKQGPREDYFYYLGRYFDHVTGVQ